MLPNMIAGARVFLDRSCFDDFHFRFSFFVQLKSPLNMESFLTLSKKGKDFFSKKNSTLQNKSLYFTEKSTPPAEPLF